MPDYNLNYWLFNVKSCLYILDIGLGVRVFANGPGDLGSIPGRVIPKTQKMVLDASLLNTQHYKVRIKGKVEQSREGVAPPPTPWCSSYRKGAFGLPSTMVANFTYLLCKRVLLITFLNEPGHIFLDTVLSIFSNLQNSLLWCGTRSNKWGTYWDSNSLL